MTRRAKDRWVILFWVIFAALIAKDAIAFFVAMTIIMIRGG